MNTAIALAALTALATTAGGILAIRVRDRLHLILGLSAGLLLGLVAFDLLPEIFEMNTSTLARVPVVSIALVTGFLALHFAEQIFGSHEPVHSDYGHEHKHSVNVAGTLGALAMAGHVFLDGLALGLAFKISDALGYAVFVAILAHAFSDGLNTVSLLIKRAALGSFISFSDQSMAIYLAAFSGFVIYLATSHILPEAHARHPSRLTMLATIFGVIAMWLIVGNIGE